jgi:hypothetical protein
VYVGSTSNLPGCYAPSKSNLEALIDCIMFTMVSVFLDMSFTIK